MSTLLIGKEIDDYASAHSSAEKTVLQVLNRETHLKVLQPVMLSGHLQGSLLRMFSVMIGPRYILELGTFTGYSAICLAAGLREGGVLHTIDIDEEKTEFAQRYFDKAGLSEKIIAHTGSAMSLIPKIDLLFDMVFIDADKVNYCDYYDLVFGKIPVGGYILADNVLYEGEVVLPESEQSRNAKAMHAFNRKVKADTRVEHVLIPVRDGIMLIRKISE
jgi:caffeoyl-CoA O-methyltransferase